VSHLLRALEPFRAQGIGFVSFSEQLDTSMPAGEMVFTVLGAVAELERGLIERVKAGLRNAKTKGKGLGRPKVSSDLVIPRSDGGCPAPVAASEIDRGSRIQQRVTR
jgi:DNA invertase Pin-like site-specific DNA recombinase